MFRRNILPPNSGLKSQANNQKEQKLTVGVSFHQIARRHIPEDGILYNHRRENITCKNIPVVSIQNQMKPTYRWSNF
jgi:hypothetical protein